MWFFEQDIHVDLIKRHGIEGIRQTPEYRRKNLVLEKANKTLKSRKGLLVDEYGST